MTILEVSISFLSLASSLAFLVLAWLYSFLKSRRSFCNAATSPCRTKFGPPFSSAIHQELLVLSHNLYALPKTQLCKSPPKLWYGYITACMHVWLCDKHTSALAAAMSSAASLFSRRSCWTVNSNPLIFSLKWSIDCANCSGLECRFS